VRPKAFPVIAPETYAREFAYGESWEGPACSCCRVAGARRAPDSTTTSQGLYQAVQAQSPWLVSEKMVRPANPFVKDETTRYCGFLLGQSQYIDIVAHHDRVGIRHQASGPSQASGLMPSRRLMPDP